MNPHTSIICTGHSHRMSKICFLLTYTDILPLNWQRLTINKWTLAENCWKLENIPYLQVIHHIIFWDFSPLRNVSLLLQWISKSLECIPSRDLCQTSRWNVQKKPDIKITEILNLMGLILSYQFYFTKYGYGRFAQEKDGRWPLQLLQMTTGPQVMIVQGERALNITADSIALKCWMPLATKCIKEKDIHLF